MESLLGKLYCLKDDTQNPNQILALKSIPVRLKRA